MVTCCVKGCKSSRYKNKFTNYRFFQFPRDKEICLKWIKACGSGDIRNMKTARVCSLHFVDEDYCLKDRLLNTDIKRKKLQLNAVPSQNLPDNKDGTSTVTSSAENRAAIVADAIREFDEKENTTSDDCLTSDSASAVQISNCEPALQISRVYGRVLYELESVCRTCSKSLIGQSMQEILVPIFGEAHLKYVTLVGTTWEELIAELNSFHLNITEGDELPQQICAECIQKLVQVISFRNHCQESQLFLGNIFKKSDVGNEYGISSDCTDIEIKLEVDESNTFSNEKDVFCDAFSNKNSIVTESIDNSLEIPNLDPQSYIEKSITAQKNELPISNLSKNNGPYECTECGERFTNKRFLFNHTSSHKRNRLYGCDVCPLRFQNLAKLKWHARSHRPEKKHKCEFCDKAFALKQHLVNHERIHTGSRPFLCNVCGKDFIQQMSLVNHLRIHSGERPYKCNRCGKAFAQRTPYVLHMRDHNGIHLHRCEICDKSFAQKQILTAHLRRHTGCYKVSPKT